MNDKFSNLDKTKQHKILQAAMKQFGEKGYDLASTNQIVEEAGISKGILFYYFQNKRSLYYDLIDYSLTIVKNEYIDQIDSTSEDIIERLSYNSKLKYQFIQQYPEVNQFLFVTLFKEIEDLPKEFQLKFAKLKKESTQKMQHYPVVNEALFKEEVNPKEAIQIIELTIEGYFHKLTTQFQQIHTIENNLDIYWNEFEALLDTLRKTFYN